MAAADRPPGSQDSNRRALLIFARRQVEDLADAGGGWDVEYGRDVWRLHNLGFEGRQTLRFDRIPQPWLKTWPNGGPAGGSVPGSAWRPAAGQSGRSSGSLSSSPARR